MSTFKHFINTNRILLKEDAYGITHIEDLPIEQFIRMLKKLPELRCVQKLDGANLVAGVDVQGRFYTSREQKGGQRFYKPADFPKRPSSDGFKTAHSALEQVKEQFCKVIKPGMAISCEVIYGEQPNTVIYGKDGMSYVAFLEPVPGDDPTKKLDYNVAKLLVEGMKGVRVNTNIEGSDTTDGINLVKAPRPMRWGFTRSDVVPAEVFTQVPYEGKLKELEEFLERPCGGAEDIGIDMTNYEVIKDKGQKTGEVRKALKEQVRDEYMLPIKQLFLDKLVYKQKPSLRGPKAGESGYMGIEGLIFVDKSTSERFKVVDRDDFTAVNKFFYQVRNRVVGRISTSNEDLSLESRGGIIGEARIRCMRLFNVPDLEMPGQAKRALEPFVGADKDETLKNVKETLKELSFEAIRRKMAAVMTHCLSELEDELDEFKSTVDNLELELKSGQTVKYTAEVKRRTLMTFAEGFRSVNCDLKAIRNANGFGDLLSYFLKDALEDLHPKNGPAPVAEPPPAEDVEEPDLDDTDLPEPPIDAGPQDEAAPKQEEE